MISLDDYGDSSGGNNTTIINQITSSIGTINSYITNIEGGKYMINITDASSFSSDPTSYLYNVSGDLITSLIQPDFTCLGQMGSFNGLTTNLNKIRLDELGTYQSNNITLGDMNLTAQSILDNSFISGYLNASGLISHNGFSSLTSLNLTGNNIIKSNIINNNNIVNLNADTISRNSFTMDKIINISGNNVSSNILTSLTYLNLSGYGISYNTFNTILQSCISGYNFASNSISDGRFGNFTLQYMDKNTFNKLSNLNLFTAMRVQGNSFNTALNLYLTGLGFSGNNCNTGTLINLNVESLWRNTFNGVSTVKINYDVYSSESNSNYKLSFSNIDRLYLNKYIPTSSNVYYSINKIVLGNPELIFNASSSYIYDSEIASSKVYLSEVPLSLLYTGQNGGGGSGSLDYMKKYELSDGNYQYNISYIPYTNAIETYTYSDTRILHIGGNCDLLQKEFSQRFDLVSINLNSLYWLTFGSINQGLINANTIEYFRADSLALGGPLNINANLVSDFACTVGTAAMFNMNAKTIFGLSIEGKSAMPVAEDLKLFAGHDIGECTFKKLKNLTISAQAINLKLSIENCKNVFVDIPYINDITISNCENVSLYCDTLLSKSLYKISTLNVKAVEPGNISWNLLISDASHQINSNGSTMNANSITFFNANSYTSGFIWNWKFYTSHSSVAGWNDSYGIWGRCDRFAYNNVPINYLYY